MQMYHLDRRETVSALYEAEQLEAQVGDGDIAVGKSYSEFDPTPFHFETQDRRRTSSSSNSSSSSSRYSSDDSSSSTGLVTPPVNYSLKLTRTETTRPTSSSSASSCSSSSVDLRQIDEKRFKNTLFTPWSSLTKIVPHGSTAKVTYSPELQVESRSLPSSPQAETSFNPPVATTLKRSKPLPLPTTPSSSISAPPHHPTFSRDEEESRRGRNRWPRLLWNSQLDQYSLDVLKAYHERAVGGPLPILTLGDSKDSIREWSLRMEKAGL